MLNWKLFNPRDIALIVAVTVAVQCLAKPLYAAINGATAPAQDNDA